MQEKSDGRTLILKCDNRGGSTPRRDMASRERRLQFGQQAAHMGRISTGSRSTGSLLTPTPVMVKYALRAQLLARKFGAKASERGTLSFRQRKLWWRTAREMRHFFGAGAHKKRHVLPREKREMKEERSKERKK